MSDEIPQKFVSVIIPTFNDSERLKICLQALEEQAYPKNLYEVIVVDNNSSENIATAVTEYKQVRLGFEASPGSYSARNTGIAMAKGEILAFTDSDCIPVSQWIEMGVRALESEGADLVGGKISFIFSSEKTAAEIYDSVFHLQVKQFVEERKAAVTANLFVRKNIFNSVGLFPSHLKSGGDVTWTKKATDAGFKLIYAADAEVYHPTRKLSSLLKKLYRVGEGQLNRYLDQKYSIAKIVSKLILDNRPPSFGFIRSRINENGTDDMHHKFFSVWLVAWLCSISTNFGRMNGAFKRLTPK